MSRKVNDDNQLSDSDSQYAEGFEDDDELMKSQVIPAFLSKTYAIMHNEEYKDIVCWGENGESILILKVDDFSKKVLPHYFKHGNFSSFVRQLNMYGFHKTRQDPNWREFKHPLFKKGHIELLPLIKRKNGGAKVKPEKREYPGEISDSALTMSVKKNKLDRDIILRDLTLLKKQTAEMEAKYTNVLQENRLLWQTIMKNKEQQDIMKNKMERICRFIYKLYPNLIQSNNDDINHNMLQDHMGYAGDMNAYGDDRYLTAEQYNNSLDYLQMNSVPRVDSPRNMPVRSTIDFNRPMNRLITNGSTDLIPRSSITFPVQSPNLSSTLQSGEIDLDDFRSVEASSQSNIPPISDLVQPTPIKEVPSSPIPPLDLGDSYIQTRTERQNEQKKPTEGVSFPSSEVTPDFGFDLSPIVINTDDIVDSLQAGVRKMDEKSNILQRRVSQMETELSSPFMVPNIEMMEKNGMF